MKAFVALVAALALVSGAAFAQLALPGAAVEAPPAAEAAPRKPKPRRPRATALPRPAVAVDSVLDKTLRLNGRDGELRLAHGDGGGLEIVKLTLLGEVVSRPSQPCRIDIVSETPLAAAAKGDPDGLPRFSADIPACPLTFDVADGAVVVPAQTNACVFAAADCQASPSGLWGPAATELDPKAIAKARAAADRSIQDSQRALERKDEGATAALTREESDFAAARDDLCQGYEAERRLGFCAAQMAETRAALLAKRAAEAGPETGARRRRKKAAP